MRSLDARLIAGLYEAIAGEAGLERALTPVHEHFGCVGSAILSVDPLAPQAAFSLGVGVMDAEAQRAYEAGFAHLDPAPAFFARAPSGSVLTTDRLFERQFRERAVVLQEFLRPHGIDETMGGGISAGDGRFAVFALYRGPDRHGFDDDDIEAVRGMLPHIEGALKLRRAFIRLETRATALAEAVDRLAAGIIALDAVNGAIHVNRAAHATALRRDGLWLDRKGIPHAANRDAERQLQRVIAGALRGGAGGVLRLPRSDDAPPYVVLVAPLPERTGLDGPDYGGGRPVVVIVHDPSTQSPAASEVIASAFDLPIQAADLIAALLRGEDARAYALRRGLSYETVRYHLKTAFARTGARSRARLLHVVALALHDIDGRR